MENKPPSKTILKNAHSLERIIRKGLQDGLTMEQLANECHSSAQALRRYMQVLGLEYRRNKTRVPTQLAASFLEMRKRGCTLEEIGRVHNVTRERVRQTLAKYYPDIVLPTFRRKLKICPICNSSHGRTISGGYCSIECKRNGQGKWLINRDMVERLIELRRNKATWDEVAKDIGFPDSGQLLRAQLQREKRLFTKEEQERYLPTRENKPKESSKETEHADPLPVLQMLGKFLRLT